MTEVPLPAPLFVGGTGRSGTSILGRLLSKHDRLGRIRGELKVHSDIQYGIAGLMRGATTKEDFLARMRTPLWRDARGSGEAEGRRLAPGRALMPRVGSDEAYEAMLTTFDEQYDSEPLEACRALILTLVRKEHEASGKKDWTEATPYNAFAGPELRKLFPRMRLVHIVRDGRDVAASVTNMRFGPNELTAALAWWDDRMRLAQAGTATVRPNRVLNLSFEDLIIRDRDATLSRLIAFAGNTDERRIRRFFDTEMPAEKGNVGRWRATLDAEQAAAFDADYVARVTKMREDGVAAAEVLTLD